MFERLLILLLYPFISCNW